jgi:pimeloyl-ACP methyl ester carboxylesterase
MAADSHAIPIAGDHFVETSGGRLFARVWTPGSATDDPPLVLIHDSLGCVELWRDFPARLSSATQRTVLAYDRLGFGRSDPRTDPLRSNFIREEAEVFLPRLLEHFRIERFVPFGHSVGGGIAISCGALLRDACTGIVTEAAQTFAEQKTLLGVAEARTEYEDPDRFARLRKYHGEKAAWVLSAWIDTWLSPAFSDWNLRHELSQLRSPLLAIHGDRDEFGSPEHLELARTSSAAPVTAKLLKGVGHVPHREQPETIMQLTAQFLAASQ